MDKIIAVHSLTNTMAIYLLEGSTEDYVFYQFSDETHVRKAPLNVGPDGDYYFTHNDEAYSLHEFQRLV
jgi:hypothetical protein